jgi:hypothetical protein
VDDRDPDIPTAGAHLWGWFWDAHKGRQEGMSGWQRIPASEWTDWQAIAGVIVRLEEWQILRDMDAAFVTAARQAHDETRPRSGGQELTPEAFDAVFG